MGEELAIGDEVLFFLFDDDHHGVHDHSHIMGTILTNDIVYYHALPITKEKNC